MAHAINRSNLGAWLLKCNPALWDLAAFLGPVSGSHRGRYNATTAPR